MATVQIIFPDQPKGAVHPAPVINDEIVSVVQGHVVTWEIVSFNPAIHEVAVEFDKPDPLMAEKISSPAGRQSMRQVLERAAQREAENPGRRNFFIRGEGPVAEPSPAGRVALRFPADENGRRLEPRIGRGVLWGTAPSQPTVSYDADRYKYTVYAYGADGKLLIEKDPEVISHRPSGGTNVTPTVP
ncbi:hypothetical protein ABI59_03240 [Acidobacteria bacterium Mor1]|nr:hypothetical protein ABI59_03240 [Acidobacteria bacterium Mor1]